MRPLAHLTILELAQGRAAPFAAMLLAELGAAVIKIEPPGARARERFRACDRAKASLTARLETDAGRRIVRALAAQADALLEDFPAGALAREGLDFAALSTLNPRLVYGSCRDADADEPAAPLWLATGMLAALAGRERTGRGAHLDFSAHDGRLALSADSAALEDPQLRARGLVGSFDYPGAGEVRAVALPLRFLGWDNPAIGRPPEPGEHTEAILRERLGYSAEQIAALRAAGAI